MTRSLLLALAFVTSACAIDTQDSEDDALEDPSASSDALAKEPAAKAGEPKPTAILHFDDARAPYRDTAGSTVACEANCPKPRTLGLFGSPHTGARVDAIEFSNPTQRSGVTQSYSLAARQCLAYPADKKHVVADTFSFSGWFLLRSTPRPGYASILSRWDSKDGGKKQFDIALRTKKSNGAATVAVSFRKALPNGDVVEVLGKSLYTTSDTSATKRFQNQWHQVVIRGTPGNIEIAVDGARTSSPVTTGIASTDVATRIGCNANSANPKGDVTTSGGDPYDSFDGKLDEFVLYDGKISDALVTSLHEQSKPATEEFGFLVGSPYEADGKTVKVDELLDALHSLHATRYAIEVKAVSGLTQARRVLEAIEARIAANDDAAFWKAFRLQIDGRVQNYGGLRDALGNLGQGLVQLKHDHPNTFSGFKIDDFATTAKTDSSMVNPDRLALLCDETMKEPSLELEPVVYCGYKTNPSLPEYGNGPWTKTASTQDHAMFRDLHAYLKTDYKNGKYARCLSGVTMYTAPSTAGSDSTTYVTDNAARINGCLGDLRATGLQITEGIYSSSLSTTELSETVRLKNIEVARLTNPNAFEAFALPLDGGNVTKTFTTLYADRAHFIHW